MQSFARFMADVPLRVVPQIERAVERAVEVLADPHATAEQVEAVGRALTEIPHAVERGALSALRGELHARLVERLGVRGLPADEAARLLEPRVTDLLCAMERVRGAAAPAGAWLRRAGGAMLASAAVGAAMLVGSALRGPAPARAVSAPASPDASPALAREQAEAVEALRKHMEWRNQPPDPMRGFKLPVPQAQATQPMAVAAPRAQAVAAQPMAVAAPRAQAVAAQPQAVAAPRAAEPAGGAGPAQPAPAPWTPGPDARTAPPDEASRSHLGNRSIEVRSPVGTFRGSGF